jgi:hypothetical protein
LVVYTFNGHREVVETKAQSDVEERVIGVAVAGAPHPGSCGSFWKQRDGDGKLTEALRRM